MTKHSTVQSQVMWNRLISVVEEQAQALIRTAFSTSVREAGDLSADGTLRDRKLVRRLGKALVTGRRFKTDKGGGAGDFSAHVPSSHI